MFVPLMRLTRTSLLHIKSYSYGTSYWYILGYNIFNGRGPAQNVTFFYTGSHYSELQSCTLIFSNNFYFLFLFKYCTTQFSHRIVLCTYIFWIKKRLFNKLTYICVAIQFLAFFKNAKFPFISQENSKYLGLKMYFSLHKRIDIFAFCVYKCFAGNIYLCIYM